MQIGKSGSAAVLLTIGAAVAIVQCSSDEVAPVVAQLCQVNSDCNNPLSCSFGRCHNQCAETRDCPNPQRCVKGDTTGVCQLEDEVRCVRTSDCRSPLICATDSQCRNQCTTARDCLAKQVCAAGGVCAETYEVTGDMHLIGEDGGGAGGGDGAGGGAGGGAGDGSDDGGMTADVASGGNGGAGGASSDANAKDAAIAESASEAGPSGTKINVQAGSTLLVYTTDQLTVDNTGPDPLYRITNFGLSGFLIDLDGRGWGGVSSGWVGRYLAASFSKSGAAAAPDLLNQFVRSSNGQRVGVDGAGNLWTAANGTVINRIDRASLGAPVVAGAIAGLTSTLSVGYNAITSSAPTAIWFDSEGTLLLVEGNTIKRFLASALTGSGAHNDPPATMLTTSANAPLSTATALAPSGDLWFLCGVTKVLCRLAKATIAGGGTATDPTGSLTVENFTPIDMAFDRDGNLWSISTTKLILLPKADLTTTTPATSVPVVRINPPAGFATSFTHVVGVP